MCCAFIQGNEIMDILQVPKGPEIGKLMAKQVCVCMCSCIVVLSHRDKLIGQQMLVFVINMNNNIYV